MVDQSTFENLKLTKVSEETTVTTTEQPMESVSSKGGFSKDALMNFVPLILVFAIFYFFVIRPQLKKQKEQDALIKAVKKGDRVIIAGGMFGKVIKETDKDTFIIELAKDVHVEILKSSVVSLAVKMDNAPKK